MDINNSDISSYVCGEENVDKIASKCNEETNTFKTFVELDPEAEEFLKNDQTKKGAEYPNLSKLLAILRVIHLGIATLLKMRSEGLKKNKEGKSEEDILNEIKKLISEVRDGFRGIWDDTSSDKLGHLLKRFLLFSSRFLDSPINSTEYLFCVLIIVKNILEMIIDILSNASAEDKKTYESWATKSSEIWKKILGSNVLRGVAASAATAGLFVFAANIGLSALGFTAAGIAAGSIAASWMSVLGTGALFSLLQSAGVIGFSAVATGGIAIIGSVVGAAAYGIYKFATMITEEIVDIHVVKDGEVVFNYNLKYYSNSTLSTVLLKYLPVDIDIPNDVTEIGFYLENPQDKQKITVPSSSIENNAKKIIGKNTLVIFKRDPNTTSYELPFYLERINYDKWKATKNTNHAPW